MVIKLNRNLLIIGLFSIIFLLLSNTISSSTFHTYQILRNNNFESKEVYVDPSIELTTKHHLQRLERIVNKIEDEEFKIFTQELINELKKDGKVDSQDIKEILGRHECLATFNVHRGIISGKAGDWTTACGILYRPHLIRPYDADWMISWSGLGLVVWWDATRSWRDIHISVRGHEIVDQHKGIAFFQVGYWQNLGWKFGCALYQEWEFSIMAWSPLIIINPDN
jgi:hypothetical protein